MGCQAARGLARGVAVTLTAGAVALLLPSCTAASSPATRQAEVSELKVTLSDYRIATSASVLPAGRVRVDVTNAGPSTHEIELAGTADQAKNLPMDQTGLLVDEQAIGLRKIGAIETLYTGRHGSFVVTLEPGHYVLYCNFGGHYLAGMWADLTVVGGNAP